MEEPRKTRQSGKTKMSRRKKLLYWLAIDTAVAVIIICLLLNKPSIYAPSPIDISAMRSGEIPPYFNYISSVFYNGAQSQEPFELAIDQKKLSQAIAGWAEHADHVAIYAPAVVFDKGSAILMATADVEGVDMVVSITIEPTFDDVGCVKLDVSKVKVGSMWFTTIAKMTAQKMYTDHTTSNTIDEEHWRTHLAAALLTGKSFDPTLTAEDKKVRIDRITIEPGTLKIHFVPDP